LAVEIDEKPAIVLAMPLGDTLAVLIAVALSPPSVNFSNTVPTLTVPFPTNTVPTLTVPPPKPNSRQRSAAATLRRRERAVTLGFIKPKADFAAPCGQCTAHAKKCESKKKPTK
jgi:hypothetical protein